MRKQINVNPDKVLESLRKNGIVLQKRDPDSPLPEFFEMQSVDGDTFRFTRDFNMFCKAYNDIKENEKC